jgi:hypothetical protein
MPNYAVTYFVTSIGTHAEAEAEMETFVESLDASKTIHLMGINNLSRDGDRCIGFVLCDEVLATQSAYHDHVVPNLTVTTNP